MEALWSALVEIVRGIEGNPWAIAIITGVIACAVYGLIVRWTEMGANSWRAIREWSRRGWRFARSIRVARANQIYREVGARSSGLPLRSVWVAGSYGDERVSPAEKEYARQVVQRLGPELAQANISVVVGESDLLLDLCAAYRKSSNMQAGARALMVHGSLRIDDPVGFLASFLVQPPTLLIVIGGRTGGRTSQEARLARQSNVPVAAFVRSGGAAAKLRANLLIEDGEASNAVAVCMGWIQSQTTI